MSTCTAHAIAATPAARRPHRSPNEVRRRPARPDTALSLPLDPLGRAVALLDRGLPTAADETLTRALLDDPRNPDLWLAAGVARLRRGALLSARCAFEMCAWLCDEPVAREMAAMLG